MKKNDKIVLEETENGYELKNEVEEDSEIIRCPQCGSRNIHFITKRGKKFDAGNALCGGLLCGPIGLLFGAKDEPDTTVRKCMKCGKEF